MARRKSLADGIVGGGVVTSWALLLSWMFCPPVCIFLILLILAIVVLKIYVFFKKK